MTAIFAIIKRLLASNKISFIITVLVVLCATSSGDVVLSNENYTWLLALLTPFFFVFYDFTKLMHLGASKKDFFLGCLISYGFLAFCISLVNTIIYLLIDPIYPAQTVINMMDVCQWTENGIIVAALQQMFFLLLVMVFLHVLLSMQPHWYGWLIDAVFVAIICIFTPITPLRAVLAGFFQIIMLNSNAVLHIGICLLLSAALSLGGLAVLKRKTL
jgi:permease